MKSFLPWVSAVKNNRYLKWKETSGLESIRRLAEEGLSDEEIGIRSGIGVTLLRRWKKKIPEFAAAIELGRAGADYAVVEALYKKATGYSVKTSKTHKLKRIDYDPVTGKKLKEYEELALGVDESYVPPDLKAEIFWLKNRMPLRWKEKDSAESGEDEGDVGIIEIPAADRIDCAEGEDGV